MQFRIADTFTDSLVKLTNDEQKAVKTTAFDLQMNPASPGMQFHKLDKARDPNFWSVRVSRDIRLIAHKTESSLLLCYVDHHDKAYQWAAQRKLETHPKTGAAQLVEVRETIREIIVPKYIEVEQPTAPKPPLFADKSDNELLNYGVPAEWLAEVRKANEDTVLELAERIQESAQELDMGAVIQHVDNPRVEQEEHYYNAKHTRLLDLGLKPHYLSETLIDSLLVTAKQYAPRARMDTIMPWVNWRAA